MKVNDADLDLENQEDLIVAHAFNDGDGYSKTAVPLTFEHAFSNFEINMALPLQYFETEGGKDEYDYQLDYGTFFYIKSITIHGLVSDGTYTFGSGWTPGDAPGEIKITYPTGRILFGCEFENPTTVTNDFKNNTNGVRTIYERQWYELIRGGDESIMVIPQEFTPWNPANITSTSMTTGSYIKVEGAVFCDQDLKNEEDPDKIVERQSEIRDFFEKTIGSATNWSSFFEISQGLFQYSNTETGFTIMLEAISNSSLNAPFEFGYCSFKVNPDTNNKYILLPNKKYTFYVNLYKLYKATATNDERDPFIDGAEF
jgi:hypothetical protein